MLQSTLSQRVRHSLVTKHTHTFLNDQNKKMKRIYRIEDWQWNRATEYFTFLVEFHIMGDVLLGKIVRLRIQLGLPWWLSSHLPMEEMYVRSLG